MRRAPRIWLIVAVALGVLVVPFWLFLRTDSQSFRMRAGSMEPTFEPEERFTVNKEAYDEERPERYDIVVFHPPEGALEGTCGKQGAFGVLCPKPTGGAADVTFLKRVVGLPGDEVRIVEGKAVIDGRRLAEPYANLGACGPETCTFRGTITVPPDHYFVMGDNRGASDDSRFWGPIPGDQIVGRVDDCWPLGLRCTEDDRTG
ncbi:MAG TPA: signal peptidase I [Solirubrobacteraceae bacterium]|jgi:signal peptidase I